MVARGHVTERGPPPDSAVRSVYARHERVIPHLRVDSPSVEVWCHLLKGTYSCKPHIGDAVMRPFQNQLKHIPYQDARRTPLSEEELAKSATLAR